MSTTAVDLTAEGMRARAERVAALTRAGHSAADIAFILGMSRRTVERTRARLGIRLGGQCKPRISDQVLAVAEQMLIDGASVKETARSLGVSYSSIHKWLPGYAWTPTQIGQHAVMVQRMSRMIGGLR